MKYAGEPAAENKENDFPYSWGFGAWERAVVSPGGRDGSKEQGFI